jgi:hypothetical protein
VLLSLRQGVELNHECHEIPEIARNRASFHRFNCCLVGYKPWSQRDYRFSVLRLPLLSNRPQDAEQS